MPEGYPLSYRSASVLSIDQTTFLFLLQYVTVDEGITKGKKTSRFSLVLRKVTHEFYVASSLDKISYLGTEINYWNAKTVVQFS